MKKVYEAWLEKADEKKRRGNSIAFGTLDFIASERSNGDLSENAELLHRIEADTYEEAATKHYAAMNWGSYQPQGETEPCPNACGAMFYPEGSGECPNCGQIC